jgi:hypothetical protein
MKYTLRLSLIILLLIAIGQPKSYARSTYPPPVKKVKPPVEKKKNSKRLKKKLKRTFQKQLKKQNYRKQNTQDSGAVSVIFILLMIVLAIAGPFFFGVGVAGMVSALWILGLIFLGVPNLVALVGGILLCSEASNSGGIGLMFLLMFLLLVNLITGLAFFISGLIFMIPLMWAIGLALLVLFVLLFCLFILLINNSSF